MNKTIHKAKERGNANYGWLSANYSFSFANYFNPKKINFGALRVLNDDVIEGGMGFGSHPHDNMEIITIPLKGTMKHRDSLSNKWIPLKTGEVQVMSAGTGLMHSEMNNSQNEIVNLFQIWIVSNKMNVKPKYEQKAFISLDRKNKLQIIVSSIDDEMEETLKIHQDAQISRIDLAKNTSFKYALKSNNHGVYIMVIEGEVIIENELLFKRDAIGISQAKAATLNAKSNAEILLIEVPM